MLTRSILSVLLALATAAASLGQTAPILDRATHWLERHPDAPVHIGLAEIQRGHGLKDVSIASLRSAAAKAKSAAAQELLCWRMLPAGPAQRDAFRREVQRLKTLAPANAWVYVWELYLLTGDANRPALLKAIDNAPAAAPKQFPGALGEECYLYLLKNLSVPRVEAGMRVISTRDFAPLHALRDLDRALTREAEFLREGKRDANAKNAIAVRDRLRQGYVRASRHLVERLFAFHLAGQTAERDALLARVKKLPYLQNRNHLANLLERMDEPQAWKVLIAPLLASELDVIENPPDLASLPSRQVAQMNIKANKKSVRGGAIEYHGKVRFALGTSQIECEHLTVVAGDDPAAVILTGHEQVRVTGFGNYPGGILADRVTFNADSGAFTLSGDVRLHGHGKALKVRLCTLTARGEFRDGRSLLDDFKNSFTLDARLALLPKITKVYDDSELPEEVRFLLALDLLRPHLTWRAPYLPPLPDLRNLRDLVQEKNLRRDSYTFWQEALGGEAWMLHDIPPAAQTAYRDGLKAWYKNFNDSKWIKERRIVPPNLPIPDNDLFFWRLRDPRHADVQRAITLLQSIHSDELGAKAQRWRSEAGRNNTVLTFDIPGAAALGKTHSLLMDVRNTENVSFKLYRVRRPDELVFATRNIGKDFIFRDHGLDRGEGKDLVKQMDWLEKQANRGLRSRDVDRVVEPDWTPEQLVRAWQVQVADLKHHDSTNRGWRRWRHWDRHDWSSEPDARYFDDECSEHRDRLEKSYRPATDTQLSSWQCDRVVPIPGKALAEAGAYVLIAEANGQTAHVPIVVEPISLTLRRCRDGVFVLASDADGTKPLEGATVHAIGKRGAASTDKGGAAFAPVLALGDRAIVVHHQGRYAIGGFGEVFEAIYEPLDRERYWARERMDRARRGDLKETSASVYADRHVVAAYTDRPTYRPGQDVQFKLIVRKLQHKKLNDVASTRFRADDFDAKTKLTLPDLEQAVPYAVLDPKGRAIAHGSFKLNEFGTAAGKIGINTESVLGFYSLRVRIAGHPRIVPDVFAVKEYRRPNFEVKLTGVPAAIASPRTLIVNVAGQYYFGPPVAQGASVLRVWRANQSEAIAEAHSKLDANGNAKIELRLPKTLPPGKYIVVASITDDSGRTVSTSAPMRFETPNAPKDTGLDKLPRFIAVNQDLKVATSDKEVRVRQDLTDRVYTAKNGFATLQFTKPGWYQILAGAEKATIFAYGGDEDPLHFDDRGRLNDDDGPRGVNPKWVNLSDFAKEDEGHLSRWEKPSQHLLALFDHQSVKVGDKVRLLVYVPQKHAKLLFTIEGRTIFDYVVRWTDEKAGAYQVVEIPITERCFPNFYLQGRIVSDGEQRLQKTEKRLGELKKGAEDIYDDRDPRWCRVDVSKPIGTIEPGLKVQIETDRGNYQPGDTVRAHVKVTDRAGRPQAAEVSLAAVDESVFSFGEDNLDSLPAFFQTPRNERRFLPKVWRASIGKRWSKNRKCDEIDRQIRDMAKMSEAVQAQSSALSHLELKSAQTEYAFTLAPLPRLGGEMPIGQIPLAKVREHFHETATWLPQLRTDANGLARASFTLPDSLTRYRLTSFALTKATEVGVGRAHVTASLPLAVQVFLPRFAVEKDRLLAVALVHNHTDKERECAGQWQIEGATVDTADVWKIAMDKGKTLASTTIKVAAKSSAKVGVWLKLDRMGTARVVFRATAGKDTDAEVRTLPIQARGRDAEFHFNKEIQAAVAFKPAQKNVVGTFDKEGRIKLPAGFRVRDLEITLSASEMAQALTGLDYLVDYPHGCIEQTMSRFLPAVMVKHATQHSPVRLQADVAAKLPDILDKGLTRVYGHQHADGSWGWFAKDSRNVAMSVYVVYGLARCQATGTKVDGDVMRKGCEFLMQELRGNRLDAKLAARAWYALALAGHANNKELSAFANAENKSGLYRPEVWCNLALACKAAGLNEIGERFWAKIRNNPSWWGHDTESFSLRLNTQVAFGAPYRDCRDSARRILGQRTGTHWAHTRDTSWAIEALANMLGYAPDKAPVRSVEIIVDGKKVLEVRDPKELSKQLFRVRLTGDDLPAKEGLEIRLKTDAGESMHVAVRAAGVQRLDEIQASGRRVQLHRFMESLDGQAIKGPLKIGQVVRVRLRLDLTQAENYLMIEERRPTLCEFAADRVTAGRIANPSHANLPVHQEFRDDRLCVFFTSLEAGTHEFIYYLRAETPGTCSVLPGCAYPMYDAKARGETGASKVAVR